MIQSHLLLPLNLLFCSLLAGAVVEDQVVGQTPFRRYFAEDGSGRRIVFYLSGAPSGNRPLPLVVWIQGTGCSSHFGRHAGRITSGLQSVLYSVTGGRAVVLAVEKPGVQFLDEVDDMKNCRPEFLANYTLDRWAGTIADAIAAAQTLPRIDPSRTLVLGHSEGGIVAMRVANVSPRVTHAASLSGGGPAYLFHIAEFVRHKGLDPEKEVHPCWDDIAEDPDSTSKFCWGQTFRQ
jgi:pimeloyl-ACP methyl ester carboxylesterase